MDELKTAQEVKAEAKRLIKSKESEKALRLMASHPLTRDRFEESLIAILLISGCVSGVRFGQLKQSHAVNKEKSDSFYRWAFEFTVHAKREVSIQFLTQYYYLSGRKAHSILRELAEAGKILYNPESGVATSTKTTRIMRSEMKIVHGDAVKMTKRGEFDVLAHGCNCFCAMGRGIARQIREEFPEAYQVDQKTKRGCTKKLGTITTAKVGNVTIVNAYTQHHWSGQGRLAEYSAIRSAMREVAKLAKPGDRIAYPRIGAGLAKGDWGIISEIIEDELAGLDHTLVEFQPES